MSVNTAEKYLAVNVNLYFADRIHIFLMLVNSNYNLNTISIFE